ncbi:MAG: hypothetical protein CVV48_16785 [Spirochaetae bacterium HGW-Spirochaetae-4]|jgi:hypothetical protein|nr:MAG: hypothetical protein A2Y31_08725 [Spirochaetes bacterium GWC2_52_13]PKL19683.1 MAG: hypothetical protein CVV48_16785 [Spirochaetae bacterium HGW-Spirochaetae-4]HCG64033.1 hypothetical protein [Sphaerochaeta sp.]HCS36079.1 hypothetical protein [Sphaerochaeta sp.]
MLKKSVVLIVILAILATSLLFAESISVGTTTLNLNGVVSPKSLLGITQLLGASPGLETAISLDSGDILFNSEGFGVEVGTWAVSSNSSSNLVLYIDYDAFTDETLPGVQIGYDVYNGTDWIDSGNLFATLVRVGGTYPASANAGPIFIKRTDSSTYPPSTNYRTTIQFSLTAQ